MTLRNPKSFIIILIYLLVNLAIIFWSFRPNQAQTIEEQLTHSVAPEFTEIIDLNYFQLKNGKPLMSLSAQKMRSQGEESAEFKFPRGIYQSSQDDKTLRYFSNEGIYKKQQEVLLLQGSVKISSEDSEYQAEKLKYYFRKESLYGKGEIIFNGTDPKSHDRLLIKADEMRAFLQLKTTEFKGNVKGQIQRKKKYEGKLTFASDHFNFIGFESKALLDGHVQIHKEDYDLTAGKAEIYLENYNKSLKYFIMNDDVKLIEKMSSPQGEMSRVAYAERLEGFGQEQKMVLSGAPRVEMDKDIIKGYRITIRQNVDLLEIEDAMSDVMLKRKKPEELRE